MGQRKKERRSERGKKRNESTENEWTRVTSKTLKGYSLVTRSEERQSQAAHRRGRIMRTRCFRFDQQDVRVYS